ncbi:unnamed protein product [Ectocarpus sp. 6 AP-2014]
MFRVLVASVALPSLSECAFPGSWPSAEAAPSVPPQRSSAPLAFLAPPAARNHLAADKTVLIGNGRSRPLHREWQPQYQRSTISRPVYSSARPAWETTGSEGVRQQQQQQQQRWDMREQQRARRRLPWTAISSGGAEAVDDVSRAGGGGDREMTLDGATAVTAAAGPRTEARSPLPRLDGSEPDGKVKGRGEVAVIDGRGDSIRGGAPTPAGREDPVPKVDRADVPLDAAATAGAAGTIADRTPTSPASVDLESGTRSEPAAGGPPQQGETPTAAKDKGDGFGEHGWYSPADDAGSVFEWQDNTTVSTPGRASSAAAPSRTTDAPPEESSQSAASSSKNEGEEKANGKEQGGTDDNHWSERRKLVEDWEDYDEVWLSMRQEAKRAAEKEPLLVSFVYSTILNQKTLEAAVAFHLANKLAGPHMLSTQVQALVREYFADAGTPLRRTLRRDIIAVRERDPACDSYHDCLLYFKGFQALQTHRVAHWLYHTGRHALAFYLQSQVAQEFQIDIHPGAKFGEGVFIDHGTGIVVGETAVVGDDVSMLHRVTLGGSGVKSADRHPKIGNGVLIGAGACLLGNIKVGKGTQIGAGSLVATDLPERCVAVGVPAKVLGQGKKRKPALAMDQDCFKEVWGGKDI